MIKAKLCLFLAFISVLAFVPAFSQTAMDIKKLDSTLAYLNKTAQFNGTVLYAEQGKVIYKKAFGVVDINTNKPLTTASSFNLASITKQFVAMGIMQLY